MAANRRHFSLLVVLLLLAGSAALAQKKVPLLERKISVNEDNAGMEKVLQSVSQEGGFTFSYAPRVIQGSDLVSVHAENQPVRMILDELFKGQVTYKERGNHIILIRKEVKEQDESSSLVISGYIKDEDGAVITEASVFEKKSRESTISNQYGFYKLKLDKGKDPEIALFINKDRYKDTVIYVRQVGQSIINITLIPEEENAEGTDSTAIRDSLLHADQIAFFNFLAGQEAEANNRNISYTTCKELQFSVVPFVGTNGALSGITVNDYSFNWFGGYSMGTRKMELGGLFNIDRDSVKYVQGAGLFNFAGGPVEGVQAGGLANFNMKTFEGVQVAGLANFDADSLKGVQAAGLANINVKNVTGAQGAGLLNLNIGSTNGLQFAGLMNVSTKKSTGIQAAGLVNVSVEEQTGAQVSGLVNYATIVHGTQIGLLNIADSVDGVPLGLLSFVNKGYHQLEFSADEIYPLNASFRTGVRQLYNILAVGMKLDSLEEIQWYFGYGLGSAINLGKNWQLNLDLTVNQPLRSNILNRFSPLSRFNLMVEKRFNKYLSIAAGPSFNYLVYKSTDDYLQNFADNIPSSVISTDSFDNDYLGKSWIGGKFAIRFF